VDEIRQQAERARVAARTMARVERGPKDAALKLIAERLRERAPAIAGPNGRDLERATAAGVSSALLDRLAMPSKVVESSATPTAVTATTSFSARLRIWQKPLRPLAIRPVGPATTKSLVTKEMFAENTSASGTADRATTR